MNQFEFEAAYHRISKKSVAAHKISTNAIKNLTIHSKFDKNSIGDKIRKFFPILTWLPKYKWKEDITHDIFGGILHGLVHIPHGLAFASLAGVDPIHGVYSTFFSTFVHMFFGTSHHISLGTFAVISMMTGSARFRLLPDIIQNSTNIDENCTNCKKLDLGYEITPVMLTSALTFAVGVVQLLIRIFKLSFLTTYLSDQLFAGFTTGVATHILVSEIPRVMGVKLPRYSGFGHIFYTLWDIILAIDDTNWMTLGISIFGIIFLIIGNEFVNPWNRKKISISIPFEVLLVVVSIVVSLLLDLDDVFEVAVVNHMPQQFPRPSLPHYGILPYIAFDSILIAAVCCVFIISTGRQYEKQTKSKIDYKQELYAFGIMNVCSSFFPVFPSGATVSGAETEVKTQLYAVFSCILLLLAMFFASPLLEPLPACILAVIVIVNLKNLFFQFKNLPYLWRVSKFDFIIFLASFLFTVIADVTCGLGFGLIFIIFTIVLREQWPEFDVLGSTPSTDVFKPKSSYQGLEDVSKNFTLLKFDCPLHFANSAKFLDEITMHMQESHRLAAVASNGTVDQENQEKKLFLAEMPKIILDCSAISYVDLMGIDALKQAYLLSLEENVELIYVDISEKVLDMLNSTDFFAHVRPAAIFPNVMRAINCKLYANAYISGIRRKSLF